MKEERWMLIRADEYCIYEPEFFSTYCKAHEEMKKQYENYSKDCCGELNDDDAWYTKNNNVTNWKIFCVE